MWDYKHSAEQIFVDYYEDFFNSESKNYLTREHPQIFFKHIIRKYLKTKWKLTQREICSLEEKYVGETTDLSSINNSIHQNRFDLNYIYQNKIDNFFKDITEPLDYVPLLKKVRTKIQKYKASGYLNEDIARHCYSNPTTVSNILNKDRYVSHSTLIQYAENLNIDYDE